MNRKILRKHLICGGNMWYQRRRSINRDYAKQFDAFLLFTKINQVFTLKTQNIVFTVTSYLSFQRKIGFNYVIIKIEGIIYVVFN